MSILIAKRYVKALIDGKDVDTISSIAEELKLISSAYSDEKFLNIISSIDIESSKKTDLIISFVENCSNTVKNLIVLLGSNRRLNIIPAISLELNKQVSKLKNSYEGIVYSKEKLPDTYVNEMQTSFAKKFNVDLTLKNEVSSYDGIKVDIDGLGIEIGFSQERLKSQMIDHILKAV